MIDPGGSLRVVVSALLANLLVAALKFLTAFASGSTAMLAEALHSLADTGNQLFLLVGMRRSARPADARHPFGHGRESYFWGFMAAASIFLIGAVVSVREGADKLYELWHGHGRPPGAVKWALLVLGGSAALELWSLRTAVREFRQVTGGRGLRRALADLRDPSVTTVLFEDTAALFGLAVAAAGVLLSHYTGNPLWDALASVIVGLALGAVALHLGRDSKSLLIGEAVPPEQHRRIARLAAEFPGVLEVVHLRTIHIGPRDALAALKLRFARDLSVAELEDRINRLEARLRAEFPHLRRIYVEPGFDEARLRRDVQEQHC